MKWTLELVNLVGVDIFGKGLIDGLVEAGEQLGEGFASAADKHCQTVMSVGSGGNTTDGAEHADGDFAVCN